MKKLTDQQTNLIAKINLSIPKVYTLAKDAKLSNMPILERELLDVANRLQNGLDLQIRAFRDELLTEPYPLFPAGQFPYGKSG